MRVRGLVENYKRRRGLVDKTATIATEGRRLKSSVSAVLLSHDRASHTTHLISLWCSLKRVPA